VIPAHSHVLQLVNCHIQTSHTNVRQNDKFNKTK